MLFGEIEVITHLICERYEMSGHLTPRQSTTNFHASNLDLVIMTNQEVLSVPCPLCGADITGHCIVKVGFKDVWTMTEVHKARIEAYMKASLKSESVV